MQSAPPFTSKTGKNPEGSIVLHEFICDHCNRTIAWHELVIIREIRASRDELPHLHDSCADLYTEEHRGIWSKLWMLPNGGGWLLS